MVSLFFSLSVKSVFAMLTLPRGSAHEIAFAAQMHENRGRVPRFSYFQREKVSAWELSDVRVLQSQNTDCRKNEVFRQSHARSFLSGRQSVKKYYFNFYASCGSTHKIEFAEQIHKFREHVSRNLYKGRKNVPVRARFFFSIRSKAWFRARGCSENVSFSTASNPSQREGFLTIHLAYRTFLPVRCPRHP